MLNHTAIPASPVGKVSLKAGEDSPKADRVIANSSNSQKYPIQLKINTAFRSASRNFAESRFNETNDEFIRVRASPRVSFLMVSKGG